MLNGQSVLAVIPARGGSKRAPRKNLREFRGRSLIEWAVLCARESKYIDMIIVSTEDAEISDHAKPMCSVLRRPAELADDQSSAEDVLRHALNLLDHQWVVLLQPTSPLRKPQDIDACIEIAQDAYPVISVREDKSKNGSVYVTRSEWLLDGHNFDEPYTAYVMPNDRSLDIDFPEQFEVAA